MQSPTATTKPSGSGSGMKFPAARIKRIMQKNKQVGKLNATVPVMVSKAVELFIETLVQSVATETYKWSGLDVDQLTGELIIQSSDNDRIMAERAREDEENGTKTIMIATAAMFRRAIECGPSNLHFLLPKVSQLPVASDEDKPTLAHTKIRESVVATGDSDSSDDAEERAKAKKQRKRKSTSASSGGKRKKSTASVEGLDEVEPSSPALPVAAEAPVTAIPKSPSVTTKGQLLLEADEDYD